MRKRTPLVIKASQICSACGTATFTKATTKSTAKPITQSVTKLITDSNDGEKNGKLRVSRLVLKGSAIMIKGTGGSNKKIGKLKIERIE